MQIHAINSSVYVSMPQPRNDGNELAIGAFIVNVGILLVGGVQIWQWFMR